jgi:ribosomal protein S18 acetylase RimI-like enzyme
MTTNPNIRKVGSGELKNASNLFSRAVANMIACGIYQWDEIYPDESTLSEDIAKGEMYGFYQDETLCGVIVLNEVQLEPYVEVNWSFEDTKPLVVHRLCIHPDFQSRGTAYTLMKFAEDFAARNGYRSIRLDAFKNNPAALRLYQRLGYQMRGVIELRKGTFFCYEKLTPDISRQI